MTASPRTASGRALLARYPIRIRQEGSAEHNAELHAAILDIEAEMEQTAIRELKAGFQELHSWGHAHLAPSVEAATGSEGLRAALARLLRATEFPAFDMDGIPGSVRVSRTHLHPLIEAAEQARAALAAHPAAVKEEK